MADGQQLGRQTDRLAACRREEPTLPHCRGAMAARSAVRGRLAGLGCGIQTGTGSDGKPVHVSGSADWVHLYRPFTARQCRVHCRVPVSDDNHSSGWSPQYSFRAVAPSSCCWRRLCKLGSGCGCGGCGGERRSWRGLHTSRSIPLGGGGATRGSAH